MAIPRIPSYPMPERAAFPENKVRWPLEPRRAALLIHDMQRYFLNFFGEGSEVVATLVQNVAAIKRHAVQRGMPVYYTAQPIDQAPADRGLLNDMWGRGIDNQPELKDVTPLIAPTEHDVVLTKWRYNAFIRSDLADRLKAQGRDQLVICGVYAHIGCLMTAAHAFQTDVKPFLIGDAVADFSLEEHTMALRYTASRLGVVLDTQEFCQS